MGDLDLSDPGDDDDMSTYPVKDVHVHPKYEDPRFYFDVAVLEMRDDGVVFSDYVLPVCLPTPNSNPDSNSGNLVNLLCMFPPSYAQ